MAPQFNLENYVDVQERINRFWAEHPEGRIETNLMSLPDDFTQCRFKASIYKHQDDSYPAATGWAFELAGQAGANRTSHEENCETSAIGRALANMGYSKSAADRPSKQETDKVNRFSGWTQPPPSQVDVLHQAEVEASLDMANPGQIERLQTLAADLWGHRGRPHEELDDRVLADFEKGSVTMLTMGQAGQLIMTLGEERKVHMAQKRHEQARAQIPAREPAGVAGHDRFTE